MARIAIGGFQHETNCFVNSRTDISYFASHRDRPPLVYGDDLLKWLTGNSFAMAGFIDDMRESPALDIMMLLQRCGPAAALAAW